MLFRSGPSHAFGGPDVTDGSLLKGDPEANRFTNYNSGSNDGHHQGHSSCWGSSADEGSGDLAIGYKAQGSFLVDFRQVDTEPNAAGRGLGNTTGNWPEGTSYMQQGNSGYFTNICTTCNNWAYHDRTYHWMYGSLNDDATGNMRRI